MSRLWTFVLVVVLAALGLAGAARYRDAHPAGRAVPASSASPHC